MNSFLFYQKPVFHLRRPHFLVVIIVLLFQSTSGSAQWSLVGGVGLNTQAVKSISFYDAFHGVAYGTGDTAYFTKDGGATWQNETMPEPGLVVQKFSRASRRGLYAVCTNGKIIRNTVFTKLPPTPVVLSDTSYRLDSTFATNGISHIYGTATFNKLLRNPDGSLLACGYHYEGGPNAYYIHIRKVNSCGQPDSSFGTNGLVRHTFEQRNSGYDYLLQPDGKIVVCGSQAPDNASSSQKPFIARFLANGKPDSTFGINGTWKQEANETNSFVGVLQLASGRFLCSAGHVTRMYTARGRPDSTYANNGVKIFPNPPSINWSYEGRGYLRPDGKLWSICSAWPGGDTKLGIYATDTTGKIDSTFGTNGFFLEGIASVGGSFPFSGVLQSNGKLVVACTQNDVGVRLVRIMYPGKVDSTFGTNGFTFVPGSRMSFISKVMGDHILVAQTIGGVPGVQFLLLDSSGIPVPGFSINNGSNAIVISIGTGTQFTTFVEEPTGEWTMAGGATEHFQTTRVLPAQRSAMPNIVQQGDQLNAQVNLPTVTFQWFFNGNPISGATSETLAINQLGTYSVEVRSNRGCLGTDQLTITSIVGVDKMVNSANGIQIVNPVEGEIRFLQPISKNSVLRMVDSQGRMVRETKMDAGQSVVPVLGFSPGIYQLILLEEGSMERVRIVVR